jgi:hypothetical protein
VIEAGSKLTEIPERAFDNSSIASFEVPDGIAVLAEGCFFNCRQLALLAFAQASRLIEIRGRALEACVMLKSLSVPETVAVLGDQCFRKCASLENVHFASGSQLRSIGAKAFANCDNLASLCIPDSVEFVGARCYAYCEKLKSLKIDLRQLRGLCAEGTVLDYLGLLTVSKPDGWTTSDDGLVGK